MEIPARLDDEVRVLAVDDDEKNLLAISALLAESREGPWGAAGSRCASASAREGVSRSDVPFARQRANAALPGGAEMPCDDA